MLSKVKLQLLKVGKRQLPIHDFVRQLNRIVRRVSYSTHRFQYKIEWSVDNPEHFDHFMDLHFQWNRNRASFPMERGVFSSFALSNDKENKGNTLDLCCGDGFYTYFFYSLRSEKVVGIDFDPSAIKWAKKNFKTPNLEFIEGDIRSSIPDGPFDNIIWDAAIEHFTESEIISLMSRIKSVMKDKGILSGYTIVEPDHDGKHLHQHEYEFHDKEDLARFLTPYFKNVQVISTVYPMRTNLYFYASDGELPFESNLVLTKHRS